MSKLILVCPKDCRQNPYGPETIKALSDRLCPDNITPNPPLIINDNGVLPWEYSTTREHSR